MLNSVGFLSVCVFKPYPHNMSLPCNYDFSYCHPVTRSLLRVFSCYAIMSSDVFTEHVALHTPPRDILVSVFEYLSSQGKGSAAKHLSCGWIFSDRLFYR